MHKIVQFAASGMLASAFAFVATSLAAQATTGLARPAAGGLVTSPAVPNVTCQSVYVPMRDGTLLATDVYLPAGGARHPVILERTPYGFVFGAFGCFSAAEVPFAQWSVHGYTAVYQEVRGTNTSGGFFNAVVQERNDQYDAIEWSAAQPWSTGRVGTTGGSYLGIDQWMGAIQSPPHLYAIAPDIAPSDGHDSPTYENGVFRVSDMLQYGALFVPDALLHIGIATGVPPSKITAEIQTFEATEAANLGSWLSTVPLVKLPVLRGLSDWYYAWLDHPNFDAFWNSEDTETHYRDVKVPALIGGASIDLFNIGEIRNYQGMRNSAGTATARGGTKLYWQAYGHAGDSGTPTFGNDAAPWATTASDMQLAFFDHYLKGRNNGYEREANARIYVLVPPNSGELGSGFWIKADGFPLSGTRTYRYYLGSNGRANSRLGNGTLSGPATLNATRAGSAPDRYVYDPRNPVPTTGGNLLFPNPLDHKTGFQDQSTVELRNDVLVYTSSPVTRDFAVIGTVGASFWAVTSARDTDFTVKVVDVHPDGLTHNVMDRVVRARFRAGSTLPPSLITPNAPYEYSLSIGNTASIFRTGHRIRLEISSSNFPKFARNLNTAEAAGFQGIPVVARQTILHDVAHPSFLDLPVAPGVKAP